MRSTLTVKQEGISKFIRVITAREITFIIDELVNVCNNSGALNVHQHKRGNHLPVENVRFFTSKFLTELLSTDYLLVGL